jgi:hypothetical protein
VCHGFCLSTPFWEAMASKKHYTVDEFIFDIFVADNTGPKDKEVFTPIFHKMFTDKFGQEIHVWNRRFQVRVKPRLPKLEKEVVLLEFARAERFITNKAPIKGRLWAKYKGTSWLRAARYKGI